MPSLLRPLPSQAPRIDPRLWIVLLLAILLFTSGCSTLQPRANPAPPTSMVALLSTPEPLLLDGTPTPFPPEFLTNEEQTTGPAVAAAILVLVVVAGVLTQLLRHPRDE